MDLLEYVWITWNLNEKKRNSDKMMIRKAKKKFHNQNIKQKNFYSFIKFFAFENILASKNNNNKDFEEKKN